MPVEAVRADLTSLAVDVVVNAANEGLRAGSGVCGAIFAAAGPELTTACEAVGGCRTGDAVATPGFDLAARWIVHTVGPVWHGGDAGESEQLASCYRRSLEVAVGLGATSIAFPAISTGVFGYPGDEAADIAVTATDESTIGIERILLVAFDAETFDRYRARLGSSGTGSG
jgi:O-acetyl-ADP-ribose deacetylase (regulator of RNase III)